VFTDEASEPLGASSHVPPTASDSLGLCAESSASTVPARRTKYHRNKQAIQSEMESMKSRGDTSPPEEELASSFKIKDVLNQSQMIP